MKLTLAIITLFSLNLLYGQGKLSAFQKLIVGSWQAEKAPTSTMYFDRGSFMVDTYDGQSDTVCYKVAFENNAYVLKQYTDQFGEDDAVVMVITKLSNVELVLEQLGYNHVVMRYRKTKESKKQFQQKNTQ